VVIQQANAVFGRDQLLGHRSVLAQPTHRDLQFRIRMLEKLVQLPVVGVDEISGNAIFEDDDTFISPRTPALELRCSPTCYIRSSLEFLLEVVTVRPSSPETAEVHRGGLGRSSTMTLADEDALGVQRLPVLGRT